MLRPAIPVVLTLLIVAAGATAGHAAGYLKFDGIEGESRDDKHKKWIDVLSVVWGKQRPDAARGGDPDRPLVTGKRGSPGQGGPGSVTIRKSTDASSPKLQEASVKGTHIPKVEIDTLAPGERDRLVRYTLSGVTVTSYAQTGSSTGDPVEQLSLNYEKMSWTYDKSDKRAAGSRKKKGGNVETSWKVEEGEK